MNKSSSAAQVQLARISPSHWRVVLNNPPLNLMGPEFVLQFRSAMSAIERDEQLRVVVFESAVDGFFLNHSDFDAKLEDLTSIAQGPTGLEAWPDILMRIPLAPVVSIAKIRGRATGNGSELALACDMSFASSEKAILSQWEVGVGMVAGGGPMARLPRLIGRSRAMEVLLGSDDISGELAQAYGYVNRSLPDAELDEFVDALARRIASFDKWAIANTKRLVNAASLAPAVEMAAGWESCIASIAAYDASPAQDVTRDGVAQTWRRRRSFRILSGETRPVEHFCRMNWTLRGDAMATPLARQTADVGIGLDRSTRVGVLSAPGSQPSGQAASQERVNDHEQQERENCGVALSVERDCRSVPTHPYSQHVSET